MASHMGCFLGFLLIVATLFQGAAATTHIVGGSTGWTVPSSSSFYTNWAAAQNFSVGDILVFNFQTGTHDVAVVSKDDYTSCTKTNPIGSIHNTGPANITIASTGGHYYICTFGQHCVNYQKLAITVGSTTGSTTPTPSPTPTSSPGPSSPTTPTTPTGTAPTSPSSSASSLTVGGFSVLLLSTVLAFFY